MISAQWSVRGWDARLGGWLATTLEIVVPVRDLVAVSTPWSSHSGCTGWSFDRRARGLATVLHRRCWGSGPEPTVLCGHLGRVEEVLGVLSPPCCETTGESLRRFPTIVEAVLGRSLFMVVLSWGFFLCLLDLWRAMFVSQQAHVCVASTQKPSSWPTPRPVVVELCQCPLQHWGSQEEVGRSRHVRSWLGRARQGRPNCKDGASCGGLLGPWCPLGAGWGSQY